MQETVVSTGTDLKFIGAATPMTQANWQEYFSALHNKNGVLEGFDGAVGKVFDGAAIVNGLIANIETANGYTTYTQPSAEENDVLIVLRVYLKQQKVELVRKSGIAAGTSYQDCADVLVNLIQNENAYCTRNTDYYELSLLYHNRSVDNSEVVVCRRLATPESEVISNRTYLEGNNTYYFSGNTVLKINPFNPPQHVKVYADEKDSIIAFSKYFNFTYESSTYDTEIAPLVLSALPVEYYYDSTDKKYTSYGNRLEHRTSSPVACFNIVNRYKNTKYFVSVLEEESTTQNLYVNGSTGDDSNKGTSSSPLKTLEKAISMLSSDVVRTIYIAPGTYARTSQYDSFVFDNKRANISVYGTGEVVLGSSMDIKNGSVVGIIGQSSSTSFKLNGVAINVTNGSTLCCNTPTSQPLSVVVNSQDCISVSNCSHVSLYNLSFTGSSNTVAVKNGSNAFFEFDTNATIEASSGSVVGYEKHSPSLAISESTSGGGRIFTGSQS